VIWLDEGGRQRHSKLIGPPVALRETIEHFWIQAALPKNVWRVVPDLSAHVIFSIVSGPNGLSSDCRVVGARRHSFDVCMAGRVLTIGARLTPGALAGLVRDDATQLTDRSVPLDTIVGPIGLTLVEQMMEVHPREALRLFTRFFIERIGQATPLFPRDSIRHITSVRDLARAQGISRRRAYDEFSTRVGLPPKLALRIQRLHQALIVLNTTACLADAAAHAGYSDQAHFTREAAGLLGESPATWRRRRCPFIQDTNTPNGR
jgi:AraC-like DNA-binding protein